MRGLVERGCMECVIFGCGVHFLFVTFLAHLRR
jgi:hypothetical protein